MISKRTRSYWQWIMERFIFRGLVKKKTKIEYVARTSSAIVYKGFWKLFLELIRRHDTSFLDRDSETFYHKELYHDSKWFCFRFTSNSAKYNLIKKWRVLIAPLNPPPPLAGTETFQKRCLNVSFYVAWTCLERHFWKVYLTLEAKR